MSRGTSAIILILALALASGPALADQPGPGDGAPDACGAAAFTGLLGQPEAALADVVLPPRARVLHPGDVMTMDHNPERLNIDIGEDGAIASIRCG